MVRWSDGYQTAVTFTNQFCRETTPAWLALTSLLLGHRPPDLNRRFRYADLGCGNGLNAIVIAATYPHADVWGFDFNPAHIEAATVLANRAGLLNVRFVEISFADLAASPDAAMPGFEFIVAHGLMSCISPANRRHMIEIIGQRLQPGGLLYLSYAVSTGEPALVPLQVLMRMLAVATPDRPDLAVAGVFGSIERLKQVGAAFFQANPMLEEVLANIRRHDPRHIAHELFNQDFQPLMFAQVADLLADAKCDYIGSATLLENIDSISVPSGVATLLAEARDPRLKETLRDFGSARALRRDVYRRGRAPMPLAEQLAVLETTSLVGLGQGMPEARITIPTSIGPMTGRAEVYGPLLTLLEQRPPTLRQMWQIPALGERSLAELMEAVTFLVAGGYAHPTTQISGTAASFQAARRLNLAIAHGNREGAETTWLAAPAIGSALPVDLLETLVVAELLSGREVEPDRFAARIVALLGQSGRGFQREGRPITDPTEVRLLVVELVRGSVDRRIPMLRRVGILDD
jgi:Predicted methyltransferase regulatory domain/Methyltransferase domain